MASSSASYDVARLSSLSEDSAERRGGKSRARRSSGKLYREVLEAEVAVPGGEDFSGAQSKSPVRLLSFKHWGPFNPAVLDYLPESSVDPSPSDRGLSSNLEPPSEMESDAATVQHQLPDDQGDVSQESAAKVTDHVQNSDGPYEEHTTETTGEDSGYQGYHSEQTTEYTTDQGYKHYHVVNHVEQKSSITTDSNEISGTTDGDTQVAVLITPARRYSSSSSHSSSSSSSKDTTKQKEPEAPEAPEQAAAVESEQTAEVESEQIEQGDLPPLAIPEDFDITKLAAGETKQVKEFKKETVEIDEATGEQRKKTVEVSRERVVVVKKRTVVTREGPDGITQEVIEETPDSPTDSNLSSPTEYKSDLPVKEHHEPVQSEPCVVEEVIQEVEEEPVHAVYVSRDKSFQGELFADFKEVPEEDKTPGEESPKVKSPHKGKKIFGLFQRKHKSVEEPKQKHKAPKEEVDEDEVKEEPVLVITITRGQPKLEEEEKEEEEKEKDKEPKHKTKKVFGIFSAKDKDKEKPRKKKKVSKKKKVPTATLR